MTSHLMATQIRFTYEIVEPLLDFGQILRGKMGLDQILLIKMGLAQILLV